MRTYILDVMNKGHIAVARELDIELTEEKAQYISYHDFKYSTVIIDKVGSYVVFKESQSIAGTMYILTKLYVPKEYRKMGYASKLLDRCPRPLITSNNVEVVRDV